MEKICTKCGAVKELSEFHKRKDGRFGVGSECKVCLALRYKHYRENNKEKVLLQKKRWYEENREKVLLQRKHYKQSNKEALALKNKHYYEDNKEKITLQNKHYYQNNKSKCYAKNAKRRALKLTSTPPLTAKELQDISIYYELAKYLSEFGTPHEVDHIIPLSKCGLHHASNLQVITLRDNRSKNNKIKYKYKDEVYRL
jgi:hypothetical protein